MQRHADYTMKECRDIVIKNHRIMKIYIHMKAIKSTLMAALALFIAAGCEKPQNEVPVEPEFPEGIGTKNVNPGDRQTVRIVANLDWELELKSEGGSAWFWMEEGEGKQPVSKIKGEATQGQDVTIVVSDVEEYDKVRTCEVILTMKEQSKTIATLVRGSKDRNIAVWVAKSDEYGFLPSADGELLYEYEEAALATGSSLNLVWPADLNFYQMALKVTADFPWELAELPEWLETVGLSDDKALRNGTVEFRLTANIEKISLEEQKGNVVFLGGENEMISFEVVLPQTKNYITSSFPQTIEFTSAGKYVNDMGTEQDVLFKNITSANGIQVLLPYSDGEWWYSNPDGYIYNWVELTAPNGAWDNDDPSKIQTVSYQLKVSPNTSTEPRTAYILALPASLKVADPDSDLFTSPDGTGDIKEEYKPYILTTIVQKGASATYADFFKAKQSEGNVFFSKMAETDEFYYPLKDASGGCTNLYNLVFTENSDTYIALEPAAQIGAVVFKSMEWGYFPDEKQFIQVNNNQSTEFSPVSSLCKNERLDCFICFYDANGNDTPLAVVYAAYDPQGGSIPASGPFSFTYPDMVEGATLSLYNGDQLNFIKSETGITDPNSIWELKYTTPEPKMAMLNVPFLPDQYPWIGWDGNTWLSYEAMSDNQIYIDMKTDTPSTDFYAFKENGMSKYVLVCTFEPAN